jgi:hypothetical protein
MKLTLAMAVGIGFGMLTASTALAQVAGPPADTGEGLATSQIGKVQVFAGVRLWVNEWDISFIGQRRSVDVSNPSSIVLREEVVSAVSDTEIVPMPTVGVRYGNLLASMTYFAPTSYEADGGLRRSVRRSEMDVTAGYFVLPSLVVSVGYKRVNASRVVDDLDSEQRVSGVLLGISGSAPLAEKLSLYGNFAYGLARQKSEIKDARGKDDFRSTYAIGELGLSYRFLDRESGSFVKSVNGSIGYRTQIYTTRNLALGSFAESDPFHPISTSTRDLRSTTSGLVVALIATF